MYFLCEHLHQPGGWLSPGLLEIDETGTIRSVAAVLDGVPNDSEMHDAARLNNQGVGHKPQRIDGFVIPGLPNLHSHAFQRAMAGHAESAQSMRTQSTSAQSTLTPPTSAGLSTSDNFWSWRSRMYHVANKIDADMVEAIAAQLYVEMLEAGMTSVGEFHYLHHSPNEAPHARASELSLRIMRASHRAGIALTHLPVLYMRGGFDRPAESAQHRFIHRSLDEFTGLVSDIQRALAHEPIDARSLTRLGVAAHSLRAVPPDVIVALARQHPAMPFHIHVAEQTAEVDECIRQLGARPVEWLLAHANVGPAWCLVHATHMTPKERADVAARGAVVGLCPTTEANLGDGFFEAHDFIAHGGRFGIGSDSHVSVSVSEELRWLEYGERLRSRQRNILTPAQVLYERAVSGGAQALAQPVGALTPGSRADLVALDAQHPALAGHTPATLFDAFLFAGADRALRDVMVGGRWCVRDGRHVEREAIRERFRHALSALDLSQAT
ncbi:MAG: formimidoylglutamate deiminase [Deltaproteobacteria bacterium]|nr:formimidoylglutamate deiminase [Deltaproteobacteria bacterium]